MAMLIADELFRCRRCGKSKFIEIEEKMYAKGKDATELKTYESKKAIMCLGCNETITTGEFGEKTLI